MSVSRVWTTSRKLKNQVSGQSIIKYYNYIIYAVDAEMIVLHADSVTLPVSLDEKKKKLSASYFWTKFVYWYSSS